MSLSNYSVAQTVDNQSIEFSTNSTPILKDGGTTDLNDGPAQEIVIPFIHNIQNTADDEAFSPFLPQTTATIRIFYDGVPDYSVRQEEAETLVPPVRIGWVFNPIGIVDADDDGNVFIDGASRNNIVPFDFLGESIQQDAGDHVFDLNDIQAFFSSTKDTPGEGIIFGEEGNAAAFITAGFWGLGQNVETPYESGGDYLIARMEISFNRPIDNPVIHLFGLGGIWDYEGGQNNLFVNSASVEFELETEGLTLELLSSNCYDFDDEIADSKAFDDADFICGLGVEGDRIENNFNAADVIVRDSSQDGGGIGPASGSVLVRGEAVESIVFGMYARAPRNLSLIQALGDDINTCSQNCEFFGYEIFGWAGDVNDDFEFFGEYNIAEDGFLIGISSDVDPDETILTQGDSFRMLTSPVAGTTYDDLIGDLWTQGVAGGGYDTEFGLPNIFTWELGTAESNGWQTIPDLLTGVIDPGQGFLMTVFADDDFSGDDTWSNKTLSVTGSEAAPPIVVNDGGGAADGWLLLGNPFKDPIDINVLLGSRISSNLNEVVYVWDRGIGPVGSATPGWRWAITDPEVDSTSENPVLGSLDQTVLMPFQGFFIQRNTDDGNAIVTFDDDNGLTRDGLTTATTGDFFRKEVEAPNVVVLNLNGEKLENSLWLRFSESGSLERLSNDVLELASYSEHFAHFSTRKLDETQLTLAQLPVPDEDFELPVSIETTRPGTYTISASDFNLTFAQDLYLIDTELNESVRIDRNLSYTFTINQAAKANSSPAEAMMRGPQKATAEFGDRFLITTQPREMDNTMPDAVALNQNYPNPFNPTTQIRYELPQQENVRLTVYDMAGRQVAMLVNNETINAGTHTVTFDASNLASGIYMYRLQAGNTVLSRKLTVIK